MADYHLKGARARAAKLSPAERSRIARLAATARWAGSGNAAPPLRGERAALRRALQAIERVEFRLIGLVKAFPDTPNRVAVEARLRAFRKAAKDLRTIAGLL